MANNEEISQISLDQEFVDDNSAFNSIAKHFAEWENEITAFIKSTVKNHSKRWEIKIKYQKFIANMLIGIVLSFGFLLAFLIFAACFGLISDISIVITLVSSTGLAFMTSVFSLLNIIVKYMFPEKEEEFSMEILKNASQVDYQYFLKHSNNEPKQ